MLQAPLYQFISNVYTNIMMQRYHRILMGMIVVAVLSFLLSGCKTQSEELKAMLASPVSSLQLLTGREVRRSSQDKGVTLGKPIPAEVIVEYEPKSNYTERDVYDEIVGFLMNENWQREDLSTNQPGFFRASLPQDRLVIRASVNIQSDRSIVSIRLRTFPR